MKKTINNNYEKNINMDKKMKNLNNIIIDKKENSDKQVNDGEKDNNENIKKNDNIIKNNNKKFIITKVPFLCCCFGYSSNNSINNI